MPKNFEFINFDPANDLKTFSKEVFWLVEDKAPSQAAKLAKVEKQGADYRSEIKIVSSSGTFQVDFVSPDPQAAIEGAYLKIKDVLKGWSQSKLPEFEEPDIA
jgi:ribosome-associated translation inhibitor RaiA